MGSTQWRIQTSNCNACLKFVSQCYSSKLNLKKRSFGYDRTITVDAEVQKTGRREGGCLDFVLVESVSALALFCFDKDSYFIISPFFLIEGSTAKT